MSDTYEKHPGDDLPVDFDFTADHLLTATEKIVSATLTADQPTGAAALAIASAGVGAINAAGDVVQFRVSGGTPGFTYTLTCTAITTSGYDLIGCGKFYVRNC